MANVIKIYAPIDAKLEQVKYMKVNDNHADVWLRKNISKETRESTMNGEAIKEEFMVADEVLFSVDASAISENDIKNNFNKYWIYAQKWIDTDRLSHEEKIALLQDENAMLKQCIFELSSTLEEGK